ncbi:hypothetical protein ACK3TF_000414 [Chlorella vulgaris]
MRRRGAEQKPPSAVHWFEPPLPAPRTAHNSDTRGHQLVFASDWERAQQRQACEAKVAQGCKTGLRSSCSVQAVRQCTPPLLLRLLHLAPEPSWQEREACTAQHMDACLAQQLPACQQHAKLFCSEAFLSPAGAQAPQEETRTSIR